MKIKCDATQLKQTLSQVARASAPNSPIPILSQVLLRAEGERLTLTCTNDLIEISGSLPAVVEKDGSACINAKKLLALLNAEGEVTLKVGGEATVKLGKGNYKLPVISAQEFPSFPEPTGEQTPLDWEAFSNALKKCLPATPTGDNKLAGVHFFFGPHEIRATSTDTHIMVRHTTKWAGPQTEFLLPRDAASELTKLPMGSATVAANESIAWFTVGDYRLASRLLATRFPNCEGVLGREIKGGFTSPREPLIAALKRLQSVSTDDLGRVTLAFAGEVLTVSANAKDLGVGEETLLCAGDLPSALTHLQSDQLLSLLQVWEGEEVAFGFEAPHKPVHLFPMSGTYKGVIIPLVAD